MNAQIDSTSSSTSETGFPPVPGKTLQKQALKGGCECLSRFVFHFEGRNYSHQEVCAALRCLAGLNQGE